MVENCPGDEFAACFVRGTGCDEGCGNRKSTVLNGRAEALRVPPAVHLDLIPGQLLHDPRLMYGRIA